MRRVDETGDLKKGTATVGVQRQYTGTAGKIENSQVVVYLTYATPRGHAVIDRELYLPRRWADDPDRRHAARVPDHVGFATKPELARRTLQRRRWRQGSPLACLDQGGARRRRRTTGLGRWLLVRRSLTSGELAFYRCAAPVATPLAALVRVAGSRWRVEESFQASKGLRGLDQHQVRCWRSWYRWVTLAMLAYAFLAVAAATERKAHPPPPGVIALTCNEIAHVFAAVVLRPAGDAWHWLRWSWWRRRHQARARRAHYQRQAAQQP